MGHKIAISSEYGGGFSLPKNIIDILAEKKNLKATNIQEFYGLYDYGYWSDIIPRHDKDLIEFIEQFKPKGIRIVEIEDNEYLINDYDGKEFVVVKADLKWIKIDD